MRDTIRKHNPRRGLMQKQYIVINLDVQNVVILYTLRGSSVQPRSTSVKLATSMVTSPVCVTRRNKLLPSIGKPKPINYGQAEDMCMEVPHMTTQMQTALQMNNFACRLRSSASKPRKTKCQRQHTLSPMWHTDYNPITIEICI